MTLSPASIDEIYLDRVRKLCEEDLLFFARYFFKELRGESFVVNHHHQKIAEALKDIESGGNLLINMPPRYGKTELAVICWIAQSIARNPKARFIHLSFSAELALENSAKCRELIKSPQFQQLWPIQIKPDADSKAKWYTEQGGGLYATMAGGAVTGFGAGITVEDDTGLFGGCFTGNTLITTDRGKKRIDELTKDDIVLTYSHAKKTHEYERVIATQELKRNAIVKVTTHSGRTIYCTPCHRFFNGTTYEPISSFNAGDRVISHTGADVLPVQSLCKSVSQEEIGNTKGSGARAKENLLFTGMFIAGCQRIGKTTRVGASQLLNMFKDIQANQQPIGYMLDGLQESATLSQDARRWKLKLPSKSQGLLGAIREIKATGKGKGWMYLRDLCIDKAANRASYRRSKDEQQSRESDNTLPQLPHDTSQICYDTISSIEPYSTSETSVYDIQTERNHNFFAEGILVHNSIIVDDPIKPSDARSAIERNNVNDRLNSTIKNRRNSRHTPIVVIMQRLHPDDMSGFVMRGGMGEPFKHVCISALQDDDSALWPMKHTAEELKKMRDTPEDRANFWSQYQQSPIIPDGDVIKLNWFLRHDKIPEQVTTCVHSWDTAYKKDEHNDPSSCLVVRIGNNAAFVHDVVNKRMEYPELKKTIITLAARDNPSVILIEDKASGQSLIQELRAETALPIIAVKAEADKLTRAVAASATIEAGRISLPNVADWLYDYENQLVSFPNGKHDDMVDSTSQFINWWRTQSYGLWNEQIKKAFNL
jgi:predicted phage terminase large subunit-like protein